jgi:hypothetical protein
MAFGLPAWNAGTPVFDPTVLRKKFALRSPTNPYAITPDMRTAAEHVASSIIDPQLGNINEQIRQKQQDAEAYQRGAQALMGTLAQLNAPLAEAVRKAYEAAGNDVAGYGTSLTGALSDTAKTAAANAAAHIASLGAPGTVTSVAPAAAGVANFEYGQTPASNLAAEAASRFALTTQLGGANVAAVGQEALQQLNATQKEIAQLRQAGLDLENTRPGEIQKAILDLRAQDVQERQIKLQEDAAKAQTVNDKAKLAQDAAALKVQESQLNRAWLQTLDSEAYNRTNATGTLWVVKGNKIVNTGKPAPGSAAGRSQTAAAVSLQNTKTRTAATDRATQARDAHNRVMEGIANAKVQISAAQAATAAKKELAYERYLKGKTKGAAGVAGMSKAQVHQYSTDAGKAAYTLFYGAKNPKYDPSKDTSATNPIYSTAPGSASDAMRYMLSKGIPYTIAWNAIYQYASRKDSHWADALQWNPNYTPPSQRHKKTKKRG